MSNRSGHCANVSKSAGHERFDTRVGLLFFCCYAIADCKIGDAKISDSRSLCRDCAVKSGLRW
jgi:hypothetical protein